MISQAPGPLSRGELRRFALTVGAAFLAVAAVAFWRDRHGPALLLLVPGAAFLLAALAAPGRLAPVHRAWTALGVAMSRVTTPVFTAVMYFGVVTPFGLVLRLIGRRTLARPADAPSYWVRRAEGARRGDLRRQF